MSDIITLDDGTKMDEKDMYQECYTCGKRLDLGDDIQYETRGYKTYCNNTTCTEGVATLGTCLETCWWG